MTPQKNKIMPIEPSELKRGDIIACNYAINALDDDFGEREVLRVIITKASKDQLEGVILFLSNEPPWCHENVGGNWHMTTANVARRNWRMV